MEHNWLLYFTTFLCAFSISFLATPYVKKLALKWDAVDYPKKRGLHTEPIPLMGGLAIVLGFIVTMIVLVPFVPQISTIQFAGFIIGATIIVILGVLDDIYNLSAKFKLFIQIVAACIVVFTGTKINMVTWPFHTSISSMSPFITVFWIIGVTNAVNIIDGVDGLAAGVTSICSICLMILCIISGTTLAVVLTAALAGSCLGFIPRNFSPAEIFMGDTGSTFLGFVLAVSSIIGVFKSYALLSVVIAVFAIALPIIDTAFAMLRRVWRGQPIMVADRGHLHHKLVDSGYSHKATVIILYGVSLVAGIISIIIALRDMNAFIVVIFCIIILLAMIFAYRRRLLLSGLKKDDDNNKDNKKN